ncbi:MAG: DUF1552 domain-containing protein [Verrucomicrobia bacterium]|nr:DUF1552 domain-containing protein [Verrucomicrobiota bacterium]MDA0723268.1 DUF1552 domain-containing protein [Verrucomicrobiota bacterium]MDA1045875.1 DUF1552 domain-containing protein [Verrucomicrobiota bacterium]
MTTRRDFLKSSALGAGALAMPAALLAEPARGNLPKRFIFIRKSSGIRPAEIALPDFSEKDKALDEKKEPLEVDLDKHELPKWLRGLDAHKEHMTILQGLSAKMSENVHWSFSSVMGCFKSNRNTLSAIKRTTIDFELAKLFPSPFGHVELSFAGGRTGIVDGYSAPAPQTRNYCYADPDTARSELFKSVLNPEAVNSDNDMLSFLQSKEGLKTSGVRGNERKRQEKHIQSIESIRERNEKLIKISGSLAKHLPELPPMHANGGPNASTPEKQAAMTDVLIAALKADLTNVVTYTIDDLGTPITGLPGNETDRVGIHPLGHDEAFGGVPAWKTREQIRISHVNQIKTIIEKLKQVPEGKGTMFDNTMVMYFPENGETHHGVGSEAPFLIMAGSGCNLDMSGRYVRLPYLGDEGHKTLGNLYTTLLNAHGNPIKHYGDLDLEMSRKKFDQLGSIKQFMG